MPRHGRTMASARELLAKIDDAEDRERLQADLAAIAP